MKEWQGPILKLQEKNETGVVKLTPLCVNSSFCLLMSSLLHPGQCCRLSRDSFRIRSNIIRSKSASFDEINISINGKKGWIWCVVSGNGKNEFITVENSRGAPRTTVKSIGV